MLCLEVKSAKGRVTPEQKAFIERMSALGAIAGIVRSWPDAIALLRRSTEHNQHTQAERAC